MIINYICIEDHETTVGDKILIGQEITVGATDSDRWNYEIKAGFRGGDARTSVMVTLKILGGNWAPLEAAKFFCSTSDPVRQESVAAVADLFDVAWEIANRNLNEAGARKEFFGRVLS